MNTVKKEIITIGHLLWAEGLVAACSGNISVKLNKRTLFITAHHSCLGMLCERDIVKISIEGMVYGKKQATMEQSIHLAIHRHFPHAAVIHAHPPFTIGYFSVNNTLSCLTHESRLLLGEVPCVRQQTPTITNQKKVIKALQKSPIVALKRHGVIAIAESMREAFFLIQMLEDAVRVSFVAQSFRRS